MTPPGEPPPRRAARRVPGRRRRSPRWVAGVTLAAVLTAAAAVWLAYRLTRPEVRRPGEALPEITRALARNLPPDAPIPRFTEATAAAGLAGFRTFAGARSSQLPEDMGSGAAWGDYDGDGDDDLFLVAAGGTLGLAESELAPSRLYENRGDGTFGEVASFPETRVHGMAAAWGDYDGDGRLDLVVTGYQALRLFHGEAGGFVRDPRLPELPGFWAGAVWGDYDRDGDLDLYVAGYVRYVEDAGDRRRTSEQYGATVPYTLNPASFEPERNLLLRNDGATFTEVAGEAGVANPQGRSLGALWHDFDDDGWLDLYVANDISDNALFLNRGGRFEDAGLAAWVADYRGAMGLAAGDWDRDGDDDLFVTHWVAQENALFDSLLGDLPAPAPTADSSAETATGTATAPASGIRFSDVASPLGLGQIALRTVGWGAEFADFDGDGWLDLAVANGSTFEIAAAGDDPRRLVPQVPFLFWNRHGEYFHDLAPLVPALAEPRVGRGLALADYDGDGDLDLLLVDLAGGVLLLRNDMQTGHWLELSLLGRPLAGGGHAPADGATAIVDAGGVELRRTAGGASYLSQSSRTLHFGLGAADRVDAVEVRWPDGRAERYPGLAADARWQLTAGDPAPRRLGGGAAAPPAGSSQAPASATAGVEHATRADERQRRAEFWQVQRAAMDALKRDGDVARATDLFRRALAIDPAHEDARYYLASCLALSGHTDQALAELAELKRQNHQSHRAFKQWGRLRALAARSDADLAAAQVSLEHALELNREETGSLLLLGEIALLRGEHALADQRLEWACRTNPRAVGGLYLRGYLAFERGDSAEARRLLAAGAAARGPDWKPAGAVAEGDVAARMHREETPLSRLWESWDGDTEPATAFTSLEALLSPAPPNSAQPVTSAASAAGPP